MTLKRKFTQILIYLCFFVRNLPTRVRQTNKQARPKMWSITLAT